MEPRTRRRDPWPWVGFACAVSFVVLGALVIRGVTVGLDTWLAALVRDVPVPTAAWVAISDLGGPLRVPIAIGIVLAATALERLPPALIVRLLLIVGTVFLVAPVFSELAKDYVARPRPPDPLVEAAGWAFPSGHALNSTVVYGVVAVVVWRSRLPAPVRWGAVALGVAIPLLTGLSRIGLGVHWPTDVLGGWLAGVAFVAIAAVLIRVIGAMGGERTRREAGVHPTPP